MEAFSPIHNIAEEIAEEIFFRGVGLEDWDDNKDELTAMVLSLVRAINERVYWEVTWREEQERSQRSRVVNSLPEALAIYQEQKRDSMCHHVRVFRRSRMEYLTWVNTPLFAHETKLLSPHTLEQAAALIETS